MNASFSSQHFTFAPFTASLCFRAANIFVACFWFFLDTILQRPANTSCAEYMQQATKTAIIIINAFVAVRRLPLSVLLLRKHPEYIYIFFWFLFFPFIFVSCIFISFNLLEIFDAFFSSQFNMPHATSSGKQPASLLRSVALCLRAAGSKQLCKAAKAINLIFFSCLRGALSFIWLIFSTTLWHPYSEDFQIVCFEVTSWFNLGIFCLNTLPLILFTLLFCFLQDSYGGINQLFVFLGISKVGIFFVVLYTIWKLSSASSCFGIQAGVKITSSQLGAFNNDRNHQLLCVKTKSKVVKLFI